MYDSRLNKKKLVLIGPFPPPFGGVSIHIKRLAILLNANYEIIEIDESRYNKTSIFNLRSFNFIKYFRLISKSEMLHIHSGHYIFRFMHFFSSKIFNKKLIITIHSYEEKDKSLIEKYIDKFIFRNVYRVIFVSEEISQKFKLKNSLIKNAFLPPDSSEEKPLPISIIRWIEIKRNEGYTICSANASRLDMCDNQDLYGLDLCIEASKKCREENIKIAFVFVLSDTSGPLDVNLYEELIDQYNLADLFFLHKASTPFISLIRQSDIILRPTNTDGDALTVREGLFFNKKVVASDVVKRPEGTYIFKNRDLFSLVCKLNEVKNDLKKNTAILKDKPYTKLLTPEIYKEFYLTKVYN